MITIGTARVYQLNGSSWNMLGTEGDLDGQLIADDKAGISVALSSDGTIVAVGSYVMITIKEQFAYINMMVLVGIC